MLASVLLSAGVDTQSLASLVDTRFGTGEVAGQLGNTAPFAGVPFAHTFMSAQTEPSHGEQKCFSPYYSNSSERSATGISGFRATHWLSGSCVQDYGSATVMALPQPPTADGAGATEAAWQSAFSEAAAQPHYYAATLQRYGILAEATGTSRCGVLRFTFPTGAARWLVVRPNSDKGLGMVDIDPATGVVNGSNPVHRIYAGGGEPAGFRGHFRMELLGGAKAAEWGVLDDTTARANTTHGGGGGKPVAAYVRVGGTGAVEVAVCNSFSSAAAAAANGAAELGDAPTFASVKGASEAAWNEALGVVTVANASHGDTTVLYTAMWHTLLHPRAFGDVDGRHPAFDHHGFDAPTRSMIWPQHMFYMDFSMWDIFRGEVPWLSVARPQQEQRSERRTLSCLRTRADH